MKFRIRKRYVMTVDTRRCVGCQSCVLACKAENGLPENGYRSWVVSETTGEFPQLSMKVFSARCNHCSDPSCVAVCPTGASFIGGGGTVQIDQSLCTGCKACVASCPYDARYIHPDGYADKCSFCLHRVEKGQLPACAAACPAGAITFGDLEDPASEVSRLLRTRKHEVLNPSAGTRPNVYYLV